MLKNLSCGFFTLSLYGLFVILSCADRTFNKPGTSASEKFVDRSTQRTSELALTITWTALSGSYPGIYRTSYRATGASGNTFTVNAVRVDLKTPGIKLSTSPRIANGWQDGVQETLTKRVSQFITSSQSTL